MLTYFIRRDRNCIDCGKMKWLCGFLSLARIGIHLVGSFRMHEKELGVCSKRGMSARTPEQLMDLREEVGTMCFQEERFAHTKERIISYARRQDACALMRDSFGDAKKRSFFHVHKNVRRVCVDAGKSCT